MIQILKDGEVYREIETDDEQAMLRRARLRAELLSRDNDGTFTARVKPVEVVEEEVVSETV